MTNLTDLQDKLTAVELFGVLTERRRRKAIRDEERLKKEMAKEVPGLSVEARLTNENRERIAKLMQEERRKTVSKKWTIG